jgi:hypothetical protein
MTWNSRYSTRCAYVISPRQQYLSPLSSNQTISAHLAQRIGYVDDTVSMHSESRDWSAWIFAESQRRIITMARIINMVFHIECAVSCDALPGFALIPLPSNKVAWETDDEAVWCAEYDKCHANRFIYGLTTEGKLVQLRQTVTGIDSREEGWQKWLAGQDAFGMLIMLAAQLLD